MTPSTRPGKMTTTTPPSADCGHAFGLWLTLSSRAIGPGPRRSSPTCSSSRDFHPICARRRCSDELLGQVEGYLLQAHRSPAHHAIAHVPAEGAGKFKIISYR